MAHVADAHSPLRYFHAEDRRGLISSDTRNGLRVLFSGEYPS